MTLAAYVVDSNNGAADLATLAERYAGILLPEADSSARLALEASALRALIDPLSAALDDHEVRSVYEKIDAPLVGVLNCMERTGAAVDVDRLAALSRTTGDEIDRLRAEIYRSAGRSSTSIPPSSFPISCSM